MSWRHLALEAPRWSEAPSLCAQLDEPCVVAYIGGSAMMLAAAADWSSPVTLWVHIHEGYRSQLAAREIATLSWLIDLERVVLTSHDPLVDAHAEVVAALLSGDDVHLVNDVATLDGAWNRPLPPREIEIWVSDGDPTDDVVTLRAKYEGSRVVSGAEPVASTRWPAAGTSGA